MVEDDNKCKSTNGQSSEPDLPDLLKLPAGLDSLDPVDGNPFSDGDPRHRVWQDATIRAEQEVHQANVAYLKMLTEPPESEAPNEKRLLTLACYGYLILAIFDAWSFRRLHVVWSDAELKAFDQWLADYANSRLVSMKGHLPSGTEADWQLRYLRQALIGRIEHWKAEARKYVAELKEHVAALPVPENMEPPATLQPIVPTCEAVASSSDSEIYAGRGSSNAKNFESTSQAAGDKATSPRRTKRYDLSRYLDSANLTDKQYQCASLLWEYGLSITAIAKELSLHRKTVDQHISAAQSKMRMSCQYEAMRKRLAQHQPD